ncbi:hypothetical protein [Ammoniphilus sp. CFH 90114]|uniref:hypothetical protein n=1 Tax=Ammoniphilus sp. CFH 90114 TaxID=2493665 RepID=UPI00100E9203|nr:hypothetical protein [Ammoniphilus sp. CFH 90114]RXT06578.1 hypothetical protein EIZ39_16085 [Ammoniphilus sp. CFH 90114]
MSSLINRIPITFIRSSGILFMALIYLVYFFLPLDLLFWVFIFFLGLSLLFGVYYLNKASKILCASMLVMGHVIFFFYGGTADMWLESLTKNMPLVTFLVFIPLLSIPFRVEGHFKVIQEVAVGRLEGRQRFYSFVSFLTFSICIIMNMGGLRLNYEMLEDHFRRYTQTGVQALMRGYAASMLWGPYFPTVILILYYLNLPSYMYLGPALMFGLLSLGFLMLYGWMVYRKQVIIENQIPSIPFPISNSAKRKLIVFIFLVLLLIILSLALESWVGLPIMIAMSVISIVFPLVMVTLTKQKIAYIAAVRDYRIQILPKMINEVSLFLSAGFLGEMIANTNFGQVLPSLFTTLGSVSLWLMIFLLMIIIPLLAIVGVHPLVTGSVLGTSLSPAAVGLNPVSLAGTLIAGWAMALVLSPVSAINVIVGGMVDKPPYVVGLKWNWLYSFCWALFLTCVFYVYHHLF